MLKKKSTEPSSEFKKFKKLLHDLVACKDDLPNRSEEVISEKDKKSDWWMQRM